LLTDIGNNRRVSTFLVLRLVLFVLHVVIIHDNLEVPLRQLGLAANLERVKFLELTEVEQLLRLTCIPFVAHLLSFL